MDKNYNVDDILSEIKNRKLREKSEGFAGAGEISPFSGAAPEAREKGGFDLDFSGSDPEPAGGRDFKLDFSAFDPEADKEPADGGFHFQIPVREQEKTHGPLDFTGHVRPLTDRAKMRGVTPPVPDFDFRFDGDGEEEAAPDMPRPGASDTQEHTRILPGFSEAEDLSTGDIRKIDFARTRGESSDYYDDDDIITHVLSGSVVDYSEYNSINDRRDVQRDIAKVKLWLLVRAAATLLLTVVLFIFTLAGKYDAISLPEFMWPEVPETLRAYLLVMTVLTVLIALVNSSSVGGGLMALFKMHANSDSLTAFAILAAVGQGIAVVAKPSLADPAKMNLYFFVAALAMLFNALGKMTMINRILANFKIISSQKPKKALLAVDDDDFCHEFVKEASRRRPTVAYSVKAGFFTDFLALSYSDKYDVGINRAVAPVCLAGALLVSFVTFFLTSSMLSAVSTLTAMLCICATLSSAFIENVPLGKLTKKLAPQGGMVSGTKAVEDFCDTKALVLTENDLFPEGNVRLHGIKSFAQGRIDEAILDAASVLCAIDGALGPVFLEMIGGNRKLLKKVDNIVFENAMGISAWVDSRRVLIGNRRLMQNHGVMLPPEAHPQKAGEEGEMLFLANSGEVSAQFTVSYHIDEELAVELDQLAQREKLLIVHTTDANITEEKLWALYGYPLELIRILPAEWHPKFAKITKPRDEAVAEIVYTGRASALVKAVSACIAARASILSATVIQLVQIVLGYGLVAFMAFMGTIGSLTVTELCIYQIFWFLAIFVVQKVRQS